MDTFNHRAVDAAQKNSMSLIDHWTVEVAQGQAPNERTARQLNVDQVGCRRLHLFASDSLDPDHGPVRVRFARIGDVAETIRPSHPRLISPDRETVKDVR